MAGHRSGWERAERAAWAEFGRRHWRAIVGATIARRLVLPVLALAALGGLAWGAWWLWGVVSRAHVGMPAVHLPAGLGWWLVVVAAAVVVVGLVVVVARSVRSGRLRPRFFRLRFGRRPW